MVLPLRKQIGGLGNILFKQAYLWAQYSDGNIPDIYVQSEKYFKKISDGIRLEFSQGIGYVNKVSLHIRRGDYTNNDFYVNLWKTDYYKKAIAMFPEDKFIVFCRDNQDWETDKADRQWCRENLVPLLGDRFELPPKENTETDDLNLMASCKNNILANSSFSWWAGFLNPNSRKIVIAPKAWHTDGVERTECPETWIRL
jgi:hypothetical protein